MFLAGVNLVVAVVVVVVLTSAHGRNAVRDHRGEGGVAYVPGTSLRNLTALETSLARNHRRRRHISPPARIQLPPPPASTGRSLRVPSRHRGNVGVEAIWAMSRLLFSVTGGCIK